MPPSDNSVHISVIVPAYNIEVHLVLLLARITNILKSISSDYEIIVVNDGSTDGTLRVAENEGKENSRLRVISYTQNKGKGFAVRTGIIQSYGNIVMFLDGDLNISTDVIMDYIAGLHDYDLIIGSKRHPSSKVTGLVSRKILSKMFSIIVRISTGLKIKDTQVGLKIGNGNVLRSIFSIMHVNRFAFDVELLIIASLLGLKIKEVPIKLNVERRFPLSQCMQMLRDVLSITYRSKINHWYQKQIKLQITEEPKKFQHRIK